MRCYLLLLMLLLCSFVYDAKAQTQLSDLTLDNITNLTTEAAQGEVVKFNFDLHNIGDTTALNSYTIGTFISKNRKYDANDALVGIVRTGNTPIGSIDSVQAAVTIPANLATGNYFLIMVVDYQDRVEESNEANNTLLSTRLTITEGVFSDLQITNVRNLKPEAEVGDTLYFYFDLENQGDVVAELSYTIGAFLSTDQTYDVGDILTGSIRTANTPVGIIPNVLGAIAIPEDIDLGEYYLIVVADYNNGISETEEGNNAMTHAQVLTITDSRRPDLQLALLDGMSASAQQGEVMEFSYDLSNNGTADVTGIYTIGVFLSQDDLLDDEDHFVGTSPHDNTEKGTNVRIEDAIIIPSDMPPGEYHLILYIDYGNLIEELEEEDNALVSEDKLIISLGTTTNTYNRTQDLFETIVYPNPVQDELNLTIESPQAIEVPIMIYDQQARLIERRILSLTEGDNQINTPTHDWTSGQYFIRLPHTTAIRVMKL